MSVLNVSYHHLVCRYTKEYFPPAWRVWFMHEDERYSSHLGFLRCKDAELACAALEREGWDTPEKILAAPPKERERVMIEALQW